MDNRIINDKISNIKTALKHPELFENISPTEQVFSSIIGTYVATKSARSIFKSPFCGLLGLGIGALLVYRGMTGYCPVKDAL